jgi:hypothetical protein
MQLYRAQVLLGGDLRNIINPADRGYGHGVVSWPEVLVLRALHGQQSVKLLEDAGRVDPSPSARAVKAKLASQYPRERVEEMFPGASPRIDLDPPLDEPGLPMPREAAQQGDDAGADGEEAAAGAERAGPLAARDRKHRKV